MERATGALSISDTSRALARDAHYFTYGTLQRGFPNHEAYADSFGDLLGKFRTVERYPLVVPKRAACANPGCRFVHRMPVLLDLPGEGEHVEGELYALTDETLAQLDQLERGYSRRPIRVTGDEELEAHVYFIDDTASWRGLVERGEADVLPRYTLELAAGPLKDCCVRDPSHVGPHDVVALF